MYGLVSHLYLTHMFKILLNFPFHKKIIDLTFSLSSQIIKKTAIQSKNKPFHLFHVTDTHHEKSISLIFHLYNLVYFTLYIYPNKV